MEGPRYEQRKKRRVNQIMNLAIAAVVILIVIFAVQLIWGGDKAAEDDELIVDNNTVETPTIPDPIEKDDDHDQTNSTDDEDDELVIEDDDELDDELAPVPDGEWEPVGTEQDGEFTHNFDRESTNWTEMTRALRYATGLDESMIIWRLENGGSPTRARGVVSAPDEQSEPYEVYIEWFDGEGWQPIEKNKLTSNPYRKS